MVRDGQWFVNLVLEPVGRGLDDLAGPTFFDYGVTLPLAINLRPTSVGQVHTVNLVP